MELKEIRQLIRMLDGTDVSEIEISREGATVRVTRAVGQPHQYAEAMAAPMAQPMGMTAAPQPHAVAPAPAAVAAPVEPAVAARPATTTAITSPMVGTFYRASSPDASNFVEEGDVVKKGQVLCIIEAMKLMNEIESEASGRIVKILKQSANPVEFGEELFLIEPV